MRDAVRTPKAKREKRKGEPAQSRKEQGRQKGQLAMYRPRTFGKDGEGAM